MSELRVAIIGPGAMGCLFGGYLALAGNEVVLVDNHAERARRIEEEGLRIEGIRGEKKVRLRCVTDSAQAGSFDLVLVAVKAYDTAAAMDQHRGLIGPATVAMTVQNGLGNVERILERVDAARVVAGTTALGANEVEYGRIHHAGEGDTVIGPLSPEGMSHANRIAGVFAAASIPTRVIQDVQAQIWSKLVVNVGINALTAILRVRNGVLARQGGDSEAIQERAVAEALDVAASLGIALDCSALFARVKDVCRKTADNRSSMLMDVLLGRRTEIDFINGAIVERGRPRGVPTPVNATLAQLVHAIEATASEREGA